MEENSSNEVTRRSDEEAYELDLSEDEAQVDDLMRDALAAVEAADKKRAQTDTQEDPEVELTLESDIEIEDSADTPEAEVVVDGADDAQAAAQAAAQATAEAEELRKRLARTLADFDNFRKRAEKEKEDHKKYAVADVLKDILGVTDNLERALAAPGGVDELKKGVEMILRQQSEVFKRWGVEPVKAVGEAFNPAVHEAVARQDSSDIDVPTVTGELQRGYTIHGRLLRPSMVAVAMPIAKPKAVEPETVETEDTEGDSEAN